MNAKDIKSSFQLIGTSVTKLNISNSFICVPNEEKIEKTIDVSYEVNDISEMTDKEEGYVGTVTLYVKAVLCYDEHNMDIDLAIQGGFSLIHEKGNRNDMIEMLSLNGCTALYSIARGLVTSISSQVCINSTVTLPMINIFRLRDKDE